MEIEIGPLLQERGASDPVKLEKEDNLRPEDFASYHFPEPVTFEGRITSESGGILRLEGKLHLIWEAACDRCLRKVRRESVIDVDEQIYPEGYYTDSRHFTAYGGEDVAGYEEEEEINDPEEVPYHNGYYFSPDKLFSDLAILNLPIGVVCSEDCPGLCSVCGRRKDDPACHCDEEAAKAPGPFDKLRELL